MINSHAVAPQPAFSLKDISPWEALHREHLHFGFNPPIQRCHLAPVFPDGMLEESKTRLLEFAADTKMNGVKLQGFD